MKYDEILEIVGPFGRYQKLILLALMAVIFEANFPSLVYVFLAAIPPHWCYIPEIDRLNLTQEEVQELALPKVEKDGVESFSRCEAFSCANWTSVINNAHLNESRYAGCNVTTCQNGWVYDHSVYTSTVVDQWDLVCDKQPLTAMSQSVYMSGLMVGVLLFGAVSDWIGRKITIGIGMTMLTVFAIATAFSPNLTTFTILRFLTAMGSIGNFTSAFVLGLELVGPKWRVFAGMLPEYFWAIACMMLAGMAYGIRSWKYLELSFSVPCIIFFPLLIIVPESPRWLYSKNKVEKGEAILRKMAKCNGTTLPDKLDIELDESPKKSYPWDAFRYPRLRIRTIIIYFNWAVVSMVYYGLSLNTSNLGGDDHLNFFISSAIELPAYIFCHLTMDRLGRRATHCFSMLLGGVALMLTLAVPKSPEYNWALITLTMIGKFGITAAFAIIYVFTAELFPTVIRNIGVGSSSFCARIGGILAPQIALLGTYNKFLPPIVFGVFSLVAGLAAIALPETTGRRLPETFLDAENFGRSSSKAAVEPTGTIGPPLDKKHPIWNTKIESSTRL